MSKEKKIPYCGCKKGKGDTPAIENYTNPPPVMTDKIRKFLSKGKITVGFIDEYGVHTVLKK